MANKTRVHQAANGQYRVTVPKGIGEAMDLDGKRVEWTIASSQKLEMEVTDE